MCIYKNVRIKAQGKVVAEELALKQLDGFLTRLCWIWKDSYVIARSLSAHRPALWICTPYLYYEQSECGRNISMVRVQWKSRKCLLLFGVGRREGALWRHWQCFISWLFAFNNTLKAVYHPVYTELTKNWVLVSHAALENYTKEVWSVPGQVLGWQTDNVIFPFEIAEQLTELATPRCIPMTMASAEKRLREITQIFPQP